MIQLRCQSSDQENVSRAAAGVKWNQVLDNGGLAVDNVVRVQLDLEAAKA